MDSQTSTPGGTCVPAGLPLPPIYILHLLPHLSSEGGEGRAQRKLGEYEGCPLVSLLPPDVGACA
jgi:hypothetical protein